MTLTKNSCKLQAREGAYLTSYLGYSSDIVDKLARLHDERKKNPLNEHERKTRVLNDQCSSYKSQFNWKQGPKGWEDVMDGPLSPFQKPRDSVVQSYSRIPKPPPRARENTSVFRQENKSHDYRRNSFSFRFTTPPSTYRDEFVLKEGSPLPPFKRSTHINDEPFKSQTTNQELFKAPAPEAYKEKPYPDSHAYKPAQRQDCKFEGTTSYRFAHCSPEVARSRSSQRTSVSVKMDVKPRESVASCLSGSKDITPQSSKGRRTSGFFPSSQDFNKTFESPLHKTNSTRAFFTPNSSDGVSSCMRINRQPRKESIETRATKRSMSTGYFSRSGLTPVGLSDARPSNGTKRFQPEWFRRHRDHHLAYSDDSFEHSSSYSSHFRNPSESMSSRRIRQNVE
eukprot:GHVL01032547.1.p1 GENE.GHVL01032547.1~~GHVL01032547.1.p1  ORF type:complete len:396 (+),score=30.14 GHVL01032547.1:47-1234(+)